MSAGLLSSATGQVQVDFEIISGVTTADVQALNIVAGNEGARKVKGQLILNSGLPSEARVDFTFTTRDIAFDDRDFFGGNLSSQERSARMKTF